MASESHLAARLAEEIARAGPVSFEHFMRTALYSPGHGYYTRGRDVFGKQGDFFTAEQIQPVFGLAMARLVSDLAAAHVFELGAGRGEMREFFAPAGYTAIEAGSRLPDTMRGVVFANEFFDALPVRVAVKRSRSFVERVVDCIEGRFVFADGAPLDGEAADFARRYYADAADGDIVELHLEGVRWASTIARSLDGHLIAIDYGYTAREFPRYSHGTLLAYHRHTAREDVLAQPGEQDITSHVPFTVLESALTEAGGVVERFATLQSVLLDVGMRDEFAFLFEHCDEQEMQRRRLQLKTLLFGMGETFRVLVVRCGK